MKHWWKYLAMVFVLAACERTIDYDGEIAAPKLVLQAEVGEGDTIVRCYVSRSRFFLENRLYNQYDYVLADAVTQLQRGDDAWQTMSYSAQDHAFVLQLASPLKAGETLRLQASHPEYEIVSAQQTVVPKPYVQVIDVHYEKKANRFCAILILTEYPDSDVTLGLAVSCKYFLKTSRGSYTTNTGATTTVLFSFDEIFAAADNIYSTAQGFNSRYELFFKPGYPHAKVIDIYIPHSAPSENTEITGASISDLEISISAHSRDSYLYRTSMYSASGYVGDQDFDLGAEVGSMFGTEEDVQIYSNIEHGYGIFAGCSRYRVKKSNIRF